MSNELNDELHYVAKADDFTNGFEAIQAAEWVADPTDPTNTRGGVVRMGETVWLHRDHFGSGPVWTQARFANKVLGYIRLADLKKWNRLLPPPSKIIFILISPSV